MLSRVRFVEPWGGEVPVGWWALIVEAVRGIDGGIYRIPLVEIHPAGAQGTVITGRGQRSSSVVRTGRGRKMGLFSSGLGRKTQEAQTSWTMTTGVVMGSEYSMTDKRESMRAC